MDKEQKERLDYMRARLDEAHQQRPRGTWKQRLIPGVCKHEDIRCTHGDEIIGRNGRRRVCLICGRALKGLLPPVCFFTGQIHPSFVNDPYD